MDEYRRNCEALRPYGFEWLIVNDYDFFKERCRETLGVDIAPYEKIAGTRKAGDFDPAYGVIFEKELKGYDFWGHTGLDVAYGRLDRFVSDEYLSDCDIFGNDPGAICGPFSLYRNTLKINRLFRQYPNWQALLESEQMHGFDEIEFNGVVQRASDAGEIRFKSAFWQSHDVQPGHNPTPQMSLLPDGALFDRVTQQETMMFHFHRYRQWPIS